MKPFEIVNCNQSLDIFFESVKHMLLFYSKNSSEVWEFSQIKFSSGERKLTKN